MLAPQQPPLHARPPAHEAPQVWLAGLQASPIGQSDDALQPHTSVIGSQMWPSGGIAPVQSTHTTPVLPHALLPVPLTHTPAVAFVQQPVRHTLSWPIAP